MAITTTELIDRLTASGIVSAEVTSTLRRRVPGDSKTLVRELVEEGIATSYQLEALLQPKPPPLVLGDYVLLDRLGEGGMGVVYLARHRRMDRTVALKLLSRDLTTSEEAVRRFYREIQAIARLNHPNVVMAFDASEQDGEHYLVMEHVEGRDLDSIVREEGPLAVGEALAIVRQAAEGLGFAHEHHIVHRDVKPANILVTSAGQVKILDLGIARLVDGGSHVRSATLTGTGLFVGTVAYAAPEQAEDPRNADARADVYSLGCTLYRILVGRLPYDGDTAIQVVIAAREKPIPDLRAAFPVDSRGSQFLDDLQALFERMVAKSPDDRQQSMPEVIEDVQALLDRMTPGLSALRVTPPRSVLDAATPARASQPHGGDAAATQVSAGRAARTPSVPSVTEARPRGATPPVGSPRSAPRRAVVAPVSQGMSRTAQPMTLTAVPAPKRSAMGPWLGFIGGVIAMAIASVIVVRVVTRRGEPSAPPIVTPPPASSGTSESPVTIPETTVPPVAPQQRDEPQPRLGESLDLLDLATSGTAKSPLGKWRRAGRTIASSGPASVSVSIVARPGYRVTARVRQEPTDVAAAIARESPGPGKSPLSRVTAALSLVLTTSAGRTLVVDLDRPAPGGAADAAISWAGEASDASTARSAVPLLAAGAAHDVQVDLHIDHVVVGVDGRPAITSRFTSASPVDARRVDGIVGIVTAGPVTLERWTAVPFLPPGVSDEGPPLDARPRFMPAQSSTDEHGQPMGAPDEMSRPAGHERPEPQPPPRPPDGPRPGGPPPGERPGERPK